MWPYNYFCRSRSNLKRGLQTVRNRILMSRLIQSENVGSLCKPSFNSSSHLTTFGEEYPYKFLECSAQMGALADIGKRA